MNQTVFVIVYRAFSHDSFLSILSVHASLAGAMANASNRAAAYRLGSPRERRDDTGFIRVEWAPNGRVELRIEERNLNS